MSGLISSLLDPEYPGIPVAPSTQPGCPALCMLDVVIEPSKSLMIELVGAELTRTDQFSAGYVLRFPRVVKLRRDKVVIALLSRTIVEVPSPSYVVVMVLAFD